MEVSRFGRSDSRTEFLAQKHNWWGVAGAAEVPWYLVGQQQWLGFPPSVWAKGTESIFPEISVLSLVLQPSL